MVLAWIWALRLSFRYRDRDNRPVDHSAVPERILSRDAVFQVRQVVYGHRHGVASVLVVGITASTVSVICRSYYALRRDFANSAAAAASSE